MEEKFGWITTELNQVAEIIMGQSPPSSTYNENGIGLPFFQGKAEFTELYPIVSKWCSEPNKIAEPSDILISVRAPVGATNIANQKCCIGRGLAAIRYPDCNKYVFYFLRLIENELDKKGTGTTFKAISGSVLKSEKIPLAPLPEQRAIVSKIEQLFSELDNGITNLKLAQEQLKVYRQAVLKKAFEGELTKKWREHQTELPNAKDLLEEIRREREENAKVSGKRLKKVNPLTEVEFAELPRLPTGWVWVRLGEITYKIGDVDHKMPKDFPNGIPYVATNDITDELKIDFSTSKTISKEDYLILSEKIKPEIGDIIFPRYGTIGKNVLVDFNKDFLVSYSCAIIKNIPKYMDVKYVYQYLFSPIIKSEIRKYIRETTQANVGIASIEIFIFPLCSLPEQQAIVQEIETRLSVCDKIEQDIETNMEKAEALRQSILKKAFEEKLLNERELAEVRGAEDWEPAEVLLEKIKAERNNKG